MARSDYDLPKLVGVMSMTKVKNELARNHPELVATLRNTRVNGQLRGCSGFITDPDSGNIVYIDTETGFRREALYRTAKHLRDFTGGTNHFCPPSEIVTYAVELLTKCRPNFH